MARIWERARSRYQRSLSSAICRRPVQMRTTTPLVSFTFDDFPASALEVGGEILRQHGVVGTYYVSLGLLGLDEPVGRICGPRDLPEVLAQGHELGCHTFGHLDAWETEPRVFEESVLENRRALRKLVPGAHFETMSYPIACPRPATKQRIGRHFSGCRAGGQRLNAGAMDLNHLNAFFLEQARDRPRVIHDMIERNRLEKGWLIFATHDIARQPSRFGCTPEFFEDVVRRALASGARVLPVAASLADAAGIHRVGGLKSSAAG